MAREPIYFSKVQYREFGGFFGEHFRLILDIDNRELSYQEFKQKRNMPSETGIETFEFGGKSYVEDVAYPLKKIKSAKTEFEPQILRDNQYEEEVIFSYGIRLTDDDMEKLLPYCNALDFEPYRGKKMDMGDEGYIGYRDEVRMEFTAISNSYLPKLDLPMNYYYDEAHIWPSEKLFRYLSYTFFKSDNKKLRGRHITYYGGYSLFC